MLRQEDDGVSHINIYSQGKTTLGRWMSNWTRTPIETEDGHFESIEGYWAWLGRRTEECRRAVGWAAKNIIKTHPIVSTLSPAEFEGKIKKAIILKIEDDVIMAKELRESTLPFSHYYVYNGKVIDAGYMWIVLFWEEQRKQLKLR